jgi:hypothetical protein
MRGGVPPLQPQMTRPPGNSGRAFQGRKFAFLFSIAFPPSAWLDVVTLPLMVSYLCEQYSKAH